MLGSHEARHACNEDAPAAGVVERLDSEGNAPARPSALLCHQSKGPRFAPSFVLLLTVATLIYMFLGYA